MFVLHHECVKGIESEANDVVPLKGDTFEVVRRGCEEGLEPVRTDYGVPLVLR
jgi:hypothetical protein